MLGVQSHFVSKRGASLLKQTRIEWWPAAGRLPIWELESFDHREEVYMNPCLCE
uniref:Uncharacterized protein n=1 Tax=Anguilla anguilla TaxID=7936 RepID=A0A0E9U7N0_ANGAN